MNSKQKVKLAMYNAVMSFCNTNMIFIDSIPALKASYISFTGTVTLITGTTQKKAEKLTGIAIGKANARKALAREAASLAAKVYAYANTTSLDPLKEKVNFSVSYLSRLKDVALPAVCKNILKASVENVTVLAPYNVTVQTNTAFSDMITDYEAIEPDPRNALTDRRMHTLSLANLHQVADKILRKEMDKIISGYSTTHPDFFNAYTGNRMMVDGPTISTQIKGQATDRGNGKPLEGATVSITDTDITAMTNGKGRFVIRRLIPGKYTVTISKQGYETLTFWEQLVKLGQITTVSGSLPVAEEKEKPEK